ncbi:MAG: AgmX/PglI C-terminal domain-containing protein, partial [Deltaproteobacteria bacterium]
SGMVVRAGRAMQLHGGSLDRAQIDKVVAEHNDEIQRCYEKELLHDSTLQGKLQVEWVIGTTGAVQSVHQMQSTLRSTAVVACVMNSIRTWKFPHPSGGPVTVSYPFLFKGIDF